MKTYLSIGEISSMFNLNKQTLHYYDRENLFKPEYRDPETGYRRYGFDQIYGLALICYLRKIGFSISGIKSYMDLRNVNLSIEELQRQSEVLKNQYNDILTIDSAIQRKIKFSQDKINTIDIDKVEIKHYPKREYIHLGSENVLYNNEIFYSFPTIALYNYKSDLKTYEIVFGAYIYLDIKISEQYVDQIRTIEESDFLCFYHKGSYEDISKNIDLIKKQYSDLNLSCNSINFNIIDQFLEKNTEEFITEVQIPIIK